MFAMPSRRSLLRTTAGVACAGLLRSGLLPAQTASSRPASAPVRTSVMLWTLNKLGSFEQRLDMVAQAGYQNVELVDEFRNWSEADWTRSLAKLQALNLRVDAMAGMKTGFADPNGGDLFLAELQKLIPIAHRLACPQIILLSGKLLPGLADPLQQHNAGIATLRRAADLLAHEHLTGVIEPIDRLEQPEIYLDGVTEAFTLTRAVASSSLKVLYDLYHEQRSHGNLTEKLERNIDQVGLIHVADVPGRHEPGTGEINYMNIYRTLARLNYAGVLAMEFYPTSNAVEMLRRTRRDAEQS